MLHVALLSSVKISRTRATAYVVPARKIFGSWNRVLFHWSSTLLLYFLIMSIFIVFISFYSVTTSAIFLALFPSVISLCIVQFVSVLISIICSVYVSIKYSHSIVYPLSMFSRFASRYVYHLLFRCSLYLSSILCLLYILRFFLYMTQRR